MARRRTILIVLGLVVITIATVVSSKMLGARRPVLIADVLKVTPRDFRVTVSAAGAIEPVLTIQVRAAVTGRVADVLVKEGDMVKAGQEIIRLDRSDLMAQLQQAKAQVASAEADLSQLGPPGSSRTGNALEVQRAEAQLAAARARLAETRRGPSEAQIAQARAQVTQADTAARDAMRSLEAMEALYEEGAVTKAAVEEARSRMANAAAQRDAAKKQYEALLASPTNEQIEVAEAQVKEAEIALAIAGELEASKRKAREAGEARLRQARTSMALIEAGLAQTSIVAPEDATVISVPVVKGAVVTDGMPVASLARLGGIRVRARVDETDISKVAVGQQVILETDALIDARFAGRVAEIAPAAVQDGAVPRFPVLIDVEGAHERLLPGMSADVEIATYSKQDALALPVQAVVERDGKKAAFVLDSASLTVRMVEVVTGLESLTEVEVLEGIRPGDEVVVGDVATLNKLKDGDRVRRKEQKKGEKK